MEDQDQDVADTVGLTTSHDDTEPISDTRWSLVDEVRATITADAATAPPQRTDHVGAVYGRWEVRRLLGHGGFGATYLGIDARGDRAAIKVLTRLDDGARQRFDREAELLRKLGGTWTPLLLHHEGVVERGAQPWMALEFIDGPTLRRFVDHHGPIPAEALVPLARDLFDAVGHLARCSVAHRDLSPGNVMIDVYGRLRIIDLGMGRNPDDESLSGTKLPFTPGFAAPEAVSRPDGSHVGIAADLWAWGTLVSWMGTGRPPYPTQQGAFLLAMHNGELPVLDDVDPRFRRAVEAALQLDPRDRRRDAVDAALPLRPEDQLRVDLAAHAERQAAAAAELAKARADHAAELAAVEAARAEHAAELAQLASARDQQQAEVRAAAELATAAARDREATAAERDDALARLARAQNSLDEAQARLRELATAADDGDGDGDHPEDESAEDGVRARLPMARADLHAAPRSSRQTGTIEYISAPGSVFIKVPGGDTIRAASSTHADHARAFEVGETVSFRLVTGPQGPEAADVMRPSDPSPTSKHQRRAEPDPPLPSAGSDVHPASGSETTSPPEPAASGDRVTGQLLTNVDRHGAFVSVPGRPRAYFVRSDIRRPERWKLKRGDTVSYTLRIKGGRASLRLLACDVTRDLAAAPDPKMTGDAPVETPELIDGIAYLLVWIALGASWVVLAAQWVDGLPQGAGQWASAVVFTTIGVLGAGVAALDVSEDGFRPQRFIAPVYGMTALVVAAPILIGSWFVPF